MRVLTLLPIIGHVRDSKRIDMLLSKGASVEVAAFNRPHPVNRAPKAPVTVLATITNGRYLRRMAVTLLCLPTVFRLAMRNDIIYASGQDMGLIGAVVGGLLGKPVVLEVGDIRDVQLDYGFKGAFVRTIDRWMTGRLAHLVVTAEGFVTGYYNQWLGKAPPYLTIENKLEGSFVASIEAGGPPKGRPPLAGRPVVVGYFGLLRYQWSIDALATLVKQGAGQVKVVLAGAPTNGVNLSPLLELADHVDYLGPYKSPNDLRSMYEKVDVIWCCNPVSCQDSAGNNWAWARTNRFYESCLFRKPLIVLAGIGDAEVVTKLGIGGILPDIDMASVRALVDQLCPEALEAWGRALVSVPRSTYTYEGEDRRLIEIMRRAAGPAAETARSRP